MILYLRYNPAGGSRLYALDGRVFLEFSEISYMSCKHRLTLGDINSMRVRFVDIDLDTKEVSVLVSVSHAGEYRGWRQQWWTPM